jgi:hypothetical protein
MDFHRLRMAEPLYLRGPAAATRRPRTSKCVSPRLPITHAATGSVPANGGGKKTEARAIATRQANGEF